MSILVKIRATGEKLNFIRKPILTSGDLSSVRVKFIFDSAWDGYIKTAVFTQNDGTPCYKLIEDDECFILPEVVSKKCRLYIGVIGDKSGKRITSRLLAYDIGQGAGGSPMPPPSEDIYHQLLAKLDEIAANGVGDPEKLKEAIKEYCDTQNYVNKEYVDEAISNIEGCDKCPGGVYIPDYSEDGIITFTRKDKVEEEKYEFDINENNDWHEISSPETSSNYIWQEL